MSPATRLEIVFLDSWFPDRVRGSGSAVAIAGLAGGLRSLGHSVTILRPGLQLPGAAVTRLAANLGFRRRVRRLDADLIVGFDLDGFLIGRVGCPYAVALKGVAEDESRFERGWTRSRMRLLARLERRNARRADRVITTSEYSRRAAIRFYGLSPTNVGVVPEGIDVEAWSGRPAVRPAHGPPTVVSVARQYPRKNTAVLIRAMERVIASLPDARLRVIGDGPEIPRLRRLVEDLGLGASVELVGPVAGAAEVRLELARAHVFCLPSRQEGFGIVFLEAMAAGLPIVAADCGAVPEVAPHEEVSLLTDPDDVEGLAHCLLRILRDEDLRRRFEEGASTRWVRFDWTRIAGLFLAEVGAM